MREEWGVGLSLKKSQCLGGGGAEADISTLIQLEKCFAETSLGLRTPGRKRLTLSVAREGGECVGPGQGHQEEPDAGRPLYEYRLSSPSCILVFH